jgi:hypothetical protein
MRHPRPVRWGVSARVSPPRRDDTCEFSCQILLAGRPPRRNHAGAEAKMSKKYQIFISSTFADLQNERSEILKAVLDLGHIPSGMELFPAVDLNQMTYIKKIIDECDYYVLVIGARYGSTNDVGMSFTESEYRYAQEKGKVILAFIHEKPDDLPAKYGERDPVIAKRLGDFRNEVASGRLVRFWTNARQLQSLVIVALNHAVREAPGVGWVRGDAVAGEELLRENHKSSIERIRSALEEQKSAIEEQRALYHKSLEDERSKTASFEVRIKLLEGNIQELSAQKPVIARTDERPNIKLSLLGGNVFVPDAPDIKNTLTGITLRARVWNIGKPSIGIEWSLSVLLPNKAPVLAQLTAIPEKLSLSGERSGKTSISSVNELDVKTIKTAISTDVVEGDLLFYVKAKRAEILDNDTVLELSVKDAYGKTFRTRQRIGDWLAR